MTCRGAVPGLQSQEGGRGLSGEGGARTTPWGPPCQLPRCLQTCAPPRRTAPGHTSPPFTLWKEQGALPGGGAGVPAPGDRWPPSPANRLWGNSRSSQPGVLPRIRSSLAPQSLVGFSRLQEPLNVFFGMVFCFSGIRTGGVPRTEVSGCRQRVGQGSSVSSVALPLPSAPLELTARGALWGHSSSSGGRPPPPPPDAGPPVGRGPPMPQQGPSPLGQASSSSHVSWPHSPL